MARFRRHRRRHPLRRRVRRQRRPVRAAARRAGRHHQRRAEPRLDHRRHPPVQGAALALRAQRHGRSGALPAGGRGQGARFKIVFTDGVFSMDGTIAQLDAMRALCDRYGALLGIDECHATGFMGATGRGTHEHRGVFGKIDIITGTLGKALGGASGGFTAARREVVELLRQRSRPYLFSQHPDAGDRRRVDLAVLDLLEGSTALRDKLEDNTRWFRDAIADGRLRHQARRAPDRADHGVRRGQGAAARRRACSSSASMSSASSSRWCPRARRASACR